MGLPDVIFGNQDIATMLGLLPVFYFFSFLTMLFLGMPAFLLLLACDLIRWWTALAAGIFVGAVVAFVLRLPGTALAHDFAVTVPVGAATAVCFWLIRQLGHSEHVESEMPASEADK
jgi:hypothetical protein